MRTLIELNVGLSRRDGGENKLAHTVETMKRHGLHIMLARLVKGVWQGKEEITLACACFTDSPDIPRDLSLLAHALDQTTFAIKTGGIGQLCPAVPDDAFNEDFWHDPQAPAVELPKPSVDAFTFIGYLESTLIPDLRESGMDATAEDFETLVAHYRTLARACGH